MAFFLVDKPRGLTSFDVVRIFRKQLGKQKIGHTGTLDPLATGLLLVATANSTKLIEYCDTHDKTYQADIRIDGTSDTQDAEGSIQPLATIIQPTLEQIGSAVRCFLGEHDQIPPIYSALKIDGIAAYKRARAGEKINMKPRKATVHSWDIDTYDFPVISSMIHVSSGTYIRSLARDLGEKLTGGGYIQSLRRTGIAHLRVDHPSIITDLDNSDTWKSVSYEEIFPHIPCIANISAHTLDDLYLGKKTVTLSDIRTGEYFVHYPDTTMGIVEVGSDGGVRVLKNNI